jgi:hypothetical protein
LATQKPCRKFGVRVTAEVISRQNLTKLSLFLHTHTHTHTHTHKTVITLYVKYELKNCCRKSYFSYDLETIKLVSDAIAALLPANMDL